MTCGIYKITRKDTGQCYIGLSEDIEKRWYDHIHRPNLKHSYIDRAIRKYGTDKFDLEIVEELPNDRLLLMEREEYWVNKYNTYQDDFHFNLTPGGDFNPAKLPEVQAKISKALSGRKLSQKTKEKLSKVKSGKNHPMFGREHTPETRQKISEANSGHKVSQETKDKISKANSGRKHTSESKEKMSKSQNTSGYYRVCKHNAKSCKQGFVWDYKYYEDGKRKKISSIDIKKLEEKVRAKGLKWLKFD